MHRVPTRCCFLLGAAFCALAVSSAVAADDIAALREKAAKVAIASVKTISTGSVPIQAVYVLDKKSVLVVTADVRDPFDETKKKSPAEPTHSAAQNRFEWSRWELSTGRKMSSVTKELSFPANGVMISPDGKWVGVYGSAYDSTMKTFEFGAVTIWDRISGREVSAWRTRGVGIMTAAVSPSGKQIALSTLSSFDEDDLDGIEASVQIWRVPKGRNEEILIIRKRAAVASLDFGRSGKRLCASLLWMGPDFNDNWDSTHSSVVWRTRDWKEVKRLTFSNEAFFVSPKVRLYKSQLMAFEYGFLGNGTIELWNQKTGRRVRGFSVREKPSQPASFSPDGKYFAFKNQAGYRVWRFFWQPEAVDEIALLDIESGLIIARLREPKAVATAFAFTKNGRQIISGSSDGGIRIWKLPPSQ